MNKQIPWPRILAEGAVIVASILLALAADAGWDERQERADEVDLLTRLDDELREAIAHLSDWRANQHSVAQAGRILLEQTGEPAAPVTAADSVGTLLFVFNFNWDADPPTGVLTSVISTGQLGIIRSEELRAALVRWESSFVDLRRAEEGIATYNDGRIVPFLESRLAWRNILAATKQYDIGPSPFPLELGEVLSDREFESMVANRVVWVDVVVSKYDAVLADLARTRSLIDAELTGRR